jgi:hypothetical protein
MLKIRGAKNFPAPRERLNEDYEETQSEIRSQIPAKVRLTAQSSGGLKMDNGS